jgi:putative PEP-CTERM system histidine kinase
MALGGYYIRLAGGSWGAAVQLVFLVGAGFALLALMFSVVLRRRLKVFIAKHFYRNKYDYRTEWLKFVNTLSMARQHDERQVAVQSIAQVFGSSVGLLFMRSDDGEQFVLESRWQAEDGAAEGTSVRETLPVTHELIALMSGKQWIIDLDEYRGTPDVYQNVELPGWLLTDRQWRVVSPLLQLEQLVGFVVLSEPPPPFELTYEDRDLLRTLGRHVSTYLAQHAASRKLAEVGQFEAFNRLTAFMMHDLKNAVAQMSLVVRNAEKHKRNPEFIDDAISTIANAAGRIERLIEQLRQGSVTYLTQRVLLERVVDRAVSTRTTELPMPVARFIDEDLWVDADFDRLSAVLGHLIRNAQEATPTYGEVSVSLERHATQAWVVVKDTGAGMDEAFIRERLFKPFDSTKGTRGMGIGAYQVREYVHAIGGELQVQSQPGRGTVMTVQLPLAMDSAVEVPA